MPGKSHGMSGTRLYTIWKNMKQRCYNPKRGAYPTYGGKGIRVCKDWHEFVNFYEWSMLNGYTEELTIDRIDSNKNYEPSNCQWVTDTFNYRKAVEERTGVSIKNVYKSVKQTDLYTYNGEARTVKEWSILYNIPLKVLGYRLKYEWDMDRALTQPIRKKKMK
ncbi:HNH endonuclease [Bacillus phage B4]|uniref:Uncharacterized protein n=2 Tax=Bequatrovirus B4 TaxID=1918005 RepID=J9PQT5_9CAUD|nr:HNH endonuclease [Bacillus phage B4]YP_009783684.1 hypothetical protein QLX26_gp088 [Bacillus phage B5S]AEW47322.1 hypothetical protein B5S_0088 [Bacillus phage B5S]AEZ65883.1 hypothetical protein BCB4_0090 [Bacillus phage B4]